MRVQTGALHVESSTALTVSPQGVGAVVGCRAPLRSRQYCATWSSVRAQWAAEIHVRLGQALPGGEEASPPTLRWSPARAGRSAPKQLRATPRAPRALRVHPGHVRAPAQAAITTPWTAPLQPRIRQREFSVSAVFLSLSDVRRSAAEKGPRTGAQGSQRAARPVRPRRGSVVGRAPSIFIS